MLRQSAFRRIPAILMIQNSESDPAAYLGHFREALQDTRLHCVHFRMFDEQHRSLLPADVKLGTWAAQPHHATYNDPSCRTMLTPSATAASDVDYHIVGIISLGGVMDADDDAGYPYFQRVMGLMRSAIAEDVPILGICLGGQLLSRTLGGTVKRAAEVGASPERGFVVQHVEECARFDTPAHAAAATQAGIFDWFGGRRDILTYHWHNDVFSIPPGAQRIVAGPHSPNQCYQLPHRYVIGMQFHPDIDDAKAHAWISKEGITDPQAKLPPGLSSLAELEADLRAGTRMRETQDIANAIFTKWFEGVHQCQDRRQAALAAIDATEPKE